MVSILRFESNYYLDAIKNHTPFTTDELIFDFVKHTPQFHYNTLIGYKEFSTSYSSDEWLDRKFKAIPAGMYNILVEAVMAIVIRAFLVPCLLFIGEPGDMMKYSKLAIFESIRHIQRGLGWITCLFNDRYGLYHMEESNFYLTSYRCWVAKHSCINVDPNTGRGVIFA